MPSVELSDKSYFPSLKVITLSWNFLIKSHYKMVTFSSVQFSQTLLNFKAE